MQTILKAGDRGGVNLGWLDSRHSFSFGHYYDPRYQGVSVLRVINEDRVRPGAGFDTHGHQDMEIITYVLEGTIAHRDSEGNVATLPAGNVQVMSAGRGIRHSEFNASETDPLHFLQIWVRPDRTGGTPRYQELDASDAPEWLIASPDGADGSLEILQDARLWLLRGDVWGNRDLPAGRLFYLHQIRGERRVGDQLLRAGDAITVYGQPQLAGSAGDNSETLLFDLPDQAPYLP
ncbi:pirin family protein [Alcanivorax sp. S71-1-4]|uniref:pirin family protein n=1 Tax=Alcanivorax sp. S71-1-4 TaxID=1177159 RepID=UPI001357841A|nr:pirin family protein [Alcanivorax sp. S71-1-4]